MSAGYRIEIIDTLSAIATQDWNRLAGNSPFQRHEFFSALHETGCASAQSGWTPRFITLWREHRLLGAMPLYLKAHSYGEYVFDWAWADAYRHFGHRYYPKLLCAVPFTPITGRRLLAETAEQRSLLLHAALNLAKQSGASSLHCLFPEEPEAQELQSHGLMLRQGLQFHWENRGYRDFADFLEALSRHKRKNIRQERRKVREAGISCEWLEGRNITDEHWRFFTACYNHTYRQHFSTPYLNLDFFARLGETLPQHVLLILAKRESQPLAAALNLYTPERLYGRYWGALEPIPGLHFETCYYQAIEFCIARGIRCFEGGAQGEHKLARGFLPVKTWSAHWFAHPQFAQAIARNLDRETSGIAHYADELNEQSPFKK
ncbi:MAG TPA: GNAT family N-acetyltransferase [Burkholderiales bacterium]|nr:GNAT family N-acetyltransferase [Burkholderiales bacterium]